jgi:exodeoxyribonuclease-1
MPFVFYDTETTGTSVAFDQILQFAAVFTDDQLLELDQFEIRCRLLSYIVPSPAATLLSRTTASDLTDESRPSHYEMVREIREKLLSWSPAIFVGFNSIRFDENLLRQAFYKTLHPVYLTNTAGNARCDAMRLVHAASMFAPNTISIPTSENDRRTFRLDRLARANGFDHDNAHDAMGDVRATLHLCSLILQRAPDLWSSTIRLSRKPAILDFIATNPVFCLTDFYYGRPYSRIVSPIGYNEHNSNEVYVYNLTLPPEYLGGLSEARLLLRMPGRPRPVATMRANSVPILTHLERAPSFAQGLMLGREELHRRAGALRADADFRARLIAVFEATRKAREPSPYIEEQIYDGFASEADEGLMEDFHTAAWEDRLSILDRFDDARLREFGYRLVYYERPDVVDEVVRQAHSDRITRNLLGRDGEVPWATLPDAIQEANSLLERAKGPDIAFVREHRDALERRLAETTRLVAKEREDA